MMKWLTNKEPGPALLLAVALGLTMSPGQGRAAPATEENGPRTVRQAYNEGTEKFRQGKLREAEMALQSAVGSNEEAVQTVALYNLGHVRFRQGEDALKDCADAQATSARGQQANDAGVEAIKKADGALAGYD